MDALRHLVANIPDWMKRLDELTGQIEQRQIELASVTEPGSNANSSARSIRNRGSTESLKPKDEPEAHPEDPMPSPLQDGTSNPIDTTATTPPADATQQQPPSSPAGSNTPSALARQANQVKAVAQARARATLRKRQRTDSVVSAEGAAPKYRTRSLIIVYYDSYVQSFFEELVKFVSASRNMMRKAKMAAKVAEIKRLADIEMGDDEEEDPLADNGAGGLGLEVDRPTNPATPLEAAPARKEGEEEETLKLNYVSTRRMQPVSRTPNMTANMIRGAAGRPSYVRPGWSGARAGGPPGLPDKPPDVYDELDKGLEYVQSMCEHGAHQFLRDGDCGEEVGNIQRRLGETKELADKEMDRVKREDPEAFSSGAEKTRSYRPHSMRREHSSGKDVSMELEVDEAVENVADGDMGPPPKLVYKSTRMMR